LRLGLPRSPGAGGPPPPTAESYGQGIFTLVGWRTFFASKKIYGPFTLEFRRCHRFLNWSRAFRARQILLGHGILQQAAPRDSPQVDSRRPPLPRFTSPTIGSLSPCFRICPPTVPFSSFPSFLLLLSSPSLGWHIRKSRLFGWYASGVRFPRTPGLELFFLMTSRLRPRSYSSFFRQRDHSQTPPGNSSVPVSFFFLSRAR